MIKESEQKISWQNYKAEIDLMAIKTHNMKRELIKQAKKAGWWSTAIGYPAKILLTLNATGDGIQIFGKNEDDLWIIYVKTIFNLIALILVTTKDSFGFEKKKEKLYSAAKAIEGLNDMVKFQSYRIRGTEGDRLEELMSLRNMYSELVSSNQIIQTIESTSGAITPQQMESAEQTEYSSTDTEDEEVLMTAARTPDRNKSQRVNDDRNRMMYLHKMLNDIN